MKIALNIEAVGASHGGAEKYAGVLARWLAKAGHQVHVFAREVDRGELPPNAEIHRVRPRRIPGLGWLKHYRFAAASERALKAEQFDLIVGFVKVWYQHAYVAVAGSHRASLDYSSRRFRGSLRRSLWWLSKYLNPKQWVFELINRRQFGGVHSPYLIVPSEMTAEHFQKFHHIARERIAVVPNGHSPGESRPDAESTRAAFRERHGLASDDVAVLFVARNYSLKGLGPLLEAFATVVRKHPHARLLVCGSKRQAAFRRQAQKLGVIDRVLFLGFVDSIEAAFAGSDLFCFPTFYDPCSLVVLEAMAAGRPVITTRQNGAGELIDDGVDGFVIDSPWSLDQMRDRLEGLIGDAALRREMGEQAQNRASALSLDVRAAELVAALERAAADPLAAPGLRKAA